MKHLLVTNDFPPKVGGIQSYLWELWRRLPPGAATVLAPDQPGAAAFDAAQPIRVVRAPQRALLPTAALAARIDALAAQVGAEVVLLDPALPLGHLGPRLARPYGVVVHGAEVTVPGRLPGTRGLLAGVLRGAVVVVAAGAYPAAEAARAARAALPVVVVPPGVDVDRFHPLPADQRARARARWGLAPGGRLVVSVSRLVPRKGMDVLVEAAARLAPSRPDLQVAIAGTGRDRRRLERLVARHRAPVHLLGRVPDADLPPLLAGADLFAMLCRDRWAGLEQEGFGIVFLEAAAAGLASVAGRSGGSHEAVDDGATGVVVDDPRSVDQVAAALAGLLDDGPRRVALGRAARARAEASFGYDDLAARLGAALDEVEVAR